MVFRVLKCCKGMIKCVSLHVSVVWNVADVLPLVLRASDAWLKSYCEKCARNWRCDGVCEKSVESLWAHGYECKLCSVDL